MSEADEIDRDDPEEARTIMEDLCRRKAHRRVVLQQLVESIGVADRLAPHSWAVTLWANGFRLNVGAVEVFTFFDGQVRLFMLGTPPAIAYQHGEILDTQFRSMPQPQFGFYASVGALAKVAGEAAPRHQEFVRVAAVSPTTGKPRKTPYLKTHSPGLITYARQFLDQFEKASR